MSKKKILVTGSCGFIFSNFVRHVLYHQKEYDIASIDKVVAPNSLHNIYANKGHIFYVGDVADPHFIDVVFQIERPDIVVHGAAETHVDNSISGAVPFIKSNVLGTQVIVDACVKYNVERLIYISTDEIYGQLSSESDKAWSETSPLDPRNPYSASKAAGELIVQAANKTHNLQYNITRCCNNFGPRQSADKLMPKIINNIIHGEKVPIYGQGKQLREWIHVFDNCEAIMTILRSSPPNEIYNISSGYEFSNVEVFQEICNVMEKGYDLLNFIKDPRPGHDFRYSVDSSKIRSLGWKPKFRFREGLKQCAAWYINNQWILR